MFKWFKVISKLSRQDDILMALEAKVDAISSQMMQFSAESVKTVESLQKASNEANLELSLLKKSAEEFSQVVDDLACKVSEAKSDAEKIAGELESYREAIAKKVEELRTVTHAHLEAVNEKVCAYDLNVAKLGTEITRLGDSIAEFQKR